MKIKRFLTILLVATLLIGHIDFIKLISTDSYAIAENLEENSEYNRYFYEQLNPEAKEIYKAMYEMYKNGIFKTGDEDYNLTRSGHVKAEQLSNTNKLLTNFAVAKDAFEYDFPDLFYVDFSYLTIRVSSDAKGNKSAYIGAGRSDTYFLPSFTKNNIESAISTYESKINSVVELAKSVKPEKNDLRKEQIYTVHDYLTNHMVYKYENEVSNKACNSRTAFDALVYGEGVCEAYTRAFKAILDRLNIPCVCVYGVYRVTETVNEQHIWNYVKLNDNKWYAVDVTMDDPSIKGYEKSSGQENRKYCLIGKNELSVHHTSSGRLSATNYEFKEFKYPAISLESGKEHVIYSSGDLKAKLLEDSWGENDDGSLTTSGTVIVSYKGEDYTHNAEKGNYIIARFSYINTNNGEIETSDWMYLDPKYTDINVEPRKTDKDVGGYYVFLPMPHIVKAQFAVTNIPHDFKIVGSKYEGSLYFTGNPNLLEIVSDEIENKFSETYIAPPYPITTSPSTSGQLDMGTTYDVKIVFDQILVKDDSGKTPGIKLSTEILNADEGAGSALKYSKIENFTWAVDENAGTTTVQFKFTPSKQYADNYCSYNMNIEGLVGKISKKAPVTISYGCSYPCAVCAYAAQGFDWNVMGQPQLLDSSDIETYGWEAVDTTTGELSDVDILKNLTHRLTLVTTEPTPKKEEEMLNLLEEKNLVDSEDLLSSKTYNIQLTLCKKQIVKTGQGVRVCVGFPKGYDYSSLGEGVTFKAYHYKADPLTGKLTGEVEEINCVVTELGLIITCDSFSPYTIAAISNGGIELKKNVVITTDENIEVTYINKNTNKEVVAEGANSIIPEEYGKVTLKIKSKSDDFEIDEVTINGKEQLAENENVSEKEITIDFSNNELFDVAGTSMINVKSVAKVVHQKEEERSKEINVEDAKVSVSKDKLKINETAVITVKTLPSEDELEDGEILEPVIITYVSRDNNIATVDNNGIITAKAVGKTTITVVVNGDIEKDIAIEVYEDKISNPDQPVNGNTSEEEEKDSEPDSTNQDENKPEEVLDSDVPKTSDIAIEIFAGMMILSLLGITFIIYKKHNNK